MKRLTPKQISELEKFSKENAKEALEETLGEMMENLYYDYDY